MRTAAVAVVIMATLFAATAHASTIHVDWAGGADYTAIGPAVTAAVDGDTILVNPGTYSGAQNRDINLGPKNLVIRSSSGPLSTVIDCEGAGRAFALLNAETDSSTLVWGFTITHGWARAQTEDGAGAILCYHAAPVIENCIFEENEGNYAGAVKLLYGGGIVRSCLFSGNDAVAGGALHSAYCSPTISRCTFVGNTATADGSAFRAFQGSPVFRNCTFARNGSAAGGCLEFVSSPVAGTVDQCIIAFCTQGTALGGPGVTTEHSIIYANAGGDSLDGTHHDNAFVDPRFCGLDAGDVSLCANSWGLLANNTWSVDVGSLGEGCADCDTPVASATWGAIKALYR